MTHAALILLSFIPGYVVKNLLAVSALALGVVLQPALRLLHPAAVVGGAFLIAHSAAVPFVIHRYLPPAIWLEVALISTRKTALVMLMSVAAYTLRRSRLDFLHAAVPMWAILSMLGHGLLGGNSSLNAALLVACLPFAPTVFAVVPTIVVVIFFQDGLTAPAMLVAWIAMMSLEGLVLAALTAAIFFGVRFAFSPHVFTAKADRIEMYGLSWSYFREHLNVWFGAGLDAFLKLGPAIQKANSFQPNEHPWRSLHSSWLQLPFELGIPGAVLLTWLFFDSVWKSDEPGRQSLVMLGVCGLGYFPAQVPLMLAFGIWLVVRAQSKQGRKDERGPAVSGKKNG